MRYSQICVMYSTALQLTIMTYVHLYVPHDSVPQMVTHDIHRYQALVAADDTYCIDTLIYIIFSLTSIYYAGHS